jgi:hypothetical protein
MLHNSAIKTPILNTNTIALLWEQYEDEFLMYFKLIIQHSYDVDKGNKIKNCIVTCLERYFHGNNCNGNC